MGDFDIATIVQGGLLLGVCLGAILAFEIWWMRKLRLARLQAFEEADAALSSGTEGHAVEAQEPPAEKMFFVAVQTGFEDEAQAMLDRGVQVDTRDAAGMTALMRVAGGAMPGDDPEADFIEELEDILMSRGDDNHETWWEADDITVRMAKWLLGRGADVNARDALGRTPLMFACTNTTIADFQPSGHQLCMRLAKLFLEAGADINAADDEGLTPLLHAALASNYQGQRKELLPALLKAGADSTAVAKDGRSFAVCLVDGGKAGILREWLAAGNVDPNAKDAAGVSLLEHAIENSSARAETMRVLQEAGANPHLVDDGGRTLLMRAAEAAQGACMELLLQHGVNPAVRDNKGRTAYDYALETNEAAPLVPLIGLGEAIPAGIEPEDLFHSAGAMGDAAAMRRLLSHFHPGAGSQEMREAMEQAACAGHADVVQLLLDAGAYPDALADDPLWDEEDEEDEEDDDDPAEERPNLLIKVLQRTRDPRTVSTLLAAGADFKRKLPYADGNGPLRIAAAEGDWEMVRILEAAGVDVPQSVDSMLDAAAQEGRMEFIHTLLQHHTPTQQGLDEALGSAAYNGYLETVRLLERQGARPRQKSMTEAATGKNPEVLSYFLDKGFSPEETGWDEELAEGRNILMLAADECRPVQMEMLLAAGADVSRRDDSGRTALHIALNAYDVPAFGRERMVRALLAAGADPNACDAKGNHPLTLALENLGFWARRIVPMLVKAGARTDIRDPFGKTPLELARNIKYPQPILAALR